MADRRFPAQISPDGDLEVWGEDWQRNGPLLRIPPDWTRQAAAVTDRLSVACGKLYDRDQTFLDGVRRSVVTELASATAATEAVQELKADPSIPSAWDLRAEDREIVSYYAGMDAEKLDRLRMGVRLYSRGAARLAASRAPMPEH